MSKSTATYRILETDIRNSNGILDDDGVQAVCVDSCYSSLQSARSTIAAACTANTDVIVLDAIAYPGKLTCFQ